MEASASWYSAEKPRALALTTIIQVQLHVIPMFILKHIMAPLVLFPEMSDLSAAYKSVISITLLLTTAKMWDEKSFLGVKLVITIDRKSSASETTVSVVLDFLERYFFLI